MVHLSQKIKGSVLPLIELSSFIFSSQISLVIVPLRLI